MNPSAIDWSAPWLAPYRASGRRVLGAGLPAAGMDEGAAAGRHGGEGWVARALDACVPLPPAGPGGPVATSPAIRFVPQSRLPAGEPYERFIFETGSVPTRDNLHDFFNGLVWLRHPRTKRHLNALQAAEIARHGIGATRGPLRDALTLFDENGAVLDAPPELWRALLARDWQGLFVTHRDLWREARLRIFGHALLEKLVTPRKPMTAHVLVAGAPDSGRADDDEALAALLDPEQLRAKPFVPLPVLGVPLWWEGNERPGFYDDADVFRPARAPRSTTTRAALPADRRRPAA